jgi:hypothetical protein
LDTSNAFYQRQTGQGGNISGGKLRSNTINHESADAAVSHYYYYKQGLIANDAKAALESYVDGPGDLQAFVASASGLADQKFGQVNSARAVEPCNGLVTKDCLDNCTDNGFIDYGSPMLSYLDCSYQTVRLRFKGIKEIFGLYDYARRAAGGEHVLPAEIDFRLRKD